MEHEPGPKIVSKPGEQKASLEDYIADVKAGNFSNAWVDNYLKNVGCLED